MDYSWIIFALLSAITAALVAVFGKIGLTGIDTNTATTIRAIIMALFLIGLIAIQGKLGNIKPIIANHKALFYIILSGLAGALSWLFYFVALRNGPTSGVAALDRLSVVFVLVLAALFLGESLTWKSGIGISLIAIGAVFVALK